MGRGRGLRAGPINPDTLYPSANQSKFLVDRSVKNQMIRGVLVLLMALAITTTASAGGEASRDVTQSRADIPRTDPGLAPAIPYAGGPFGGFSCNAPEQAVIDHPRCRQWLESYKNWRAAYDAYRKSPDGS